MKKYIIGIDPGKKGAIAFLNIDDLQESFVVDFIDYFHVAEIITKYRNDIEIAIIERVGAMPGQGVKSMFSFGENYGFYFGVLYANQIPCKAISSNSWRRGLAKGKESVYEKAKRLFPKVELRGKRGGLLDGRCDALIIGYYEYHVQNKKADEDAVIDWLVEKNPISTSKISFDESIELKEKRGILLSNVKDCKIKSWLKRNTPNEYLIPLCREELNKLKSEERREINE